MAPKKEEPPAVQHQSSAATLPPVLQAKRWIDSIAPPGTFQTYHVDADGSVQHAGDAPEPEAGQPSQPLDQQHMSKQERKRLKRQAQKMKAQMRAEVTSHSIDKLDPRLKNANLEMEAAQHLS